MIGTSNAILAAIAVKLHYFFQMEPELDILGC